MFMGINRRKYEIPLRAMAARFPLYEDHDTDEHPSQDDVASPYKFTTKLRSEFCLIFFKKSPHISPQWEP